MSPTAVSSRDTNADGERTAACVAENLVKRYASGDTAVTAVDDLSMTCR